VSKRRTRLEYVRPYESAGLTRDGSGFRDARGRRVSAAVAQRLTDLVVPPAWQEVWFAPTANAHILAVGVDEAGRRQYIYHPDWREQQDAEKFARSLALAEELPRARRRAEADRNSPPLSRERVLWTAFRLLDATAIRIGGEAYSATGLCTLLVRNVRVDDDGLTLRFAAKSGQRALITIEDAPLTHALEELYTGRAPASRLLSWADGRRRRPLRSGDVNDYLRERVGEGFTAKDFRTLRGTLVAAAALPAALPETERGIQQAIVAATKAAAAALGNTPAVARASYIDPTVFERFLEGRTVGGRESIPALLDLLG
jgi:DNA topoisomerase-1